MTMVASRRLAVAAALVLFVMAVARAADPSRQVKLYVLHADEDKMSIVDATTNMVFKTIRVGRNPHGIAANRDGTRIYVTTEADGGLTIVDGTRDVAIKRYASLGM